MADTTPNESDEQATRETSRRLWSGVRGCLRLVLGLFLVLVAPLQLGIAIYTQARHGMGDAVEWPNWTGWVMGAVRNRRAVARLGSSALGTSENDDDRRQMGGPGGAARAG